MEVKKEKLEKKDPVVKNEKAVKKDKKKNKNLSIIIWPLLGGFILMFSFLVLTSVYMIFRFSDKITPYFDSFFGYDQPTESKTELVVTQEENNVINIVKENEASVVSIAISRLSFSEGEGLVDTSSNIGTGFVVDPNGIIVTNQHVVSDTESDYKVVTNTGDEYEVIEIIRDDVNDIAIIKIDAKDLNAVDLGDAENLSVGQSVIAIGTPLGEYSGTVTSGIISGLNRSVSASSDWFGSTTKTYEDVIQTDAAINPGNSGGPLINSQGEVIGVNFATTSGADNISFAIPINKVSSRVEEYRTYGKFIKPYLGVSYQMISDYEALYYEDVVAGALIIRLDPLGPAYSGGVEKGDIITELGGEKVNKSLAQLIQKHKVDEEIEIKVWRDGKETTLKATLIEAD